MSEGKRKASASSADRSKKSASSAPGGLVDQSRVRSLKAGAPATPGGPVVYWMSRDQRSSDNWALLHAADCAARSGVPLAVAFNLVPSFLNAQARHFGFMLRGLRETAASLQEHGVSFLLVRGAPGERIPALLTSLGASLCVTDFSPLREGRAWRDAVAAASPCPVQEVDAHNVVPVWEASDKQEYAARTIRPKITAKLPAYLTPFPALPPCAPWPAAGVPGQPAPPDWDALIAEAVAGGSQPGGVPEVYWLAPGEAAASVALANFLSPARLKLYEKRNDPNVPQALSGLSPYLHFGVLSAQRCALAAREASRATPALAKAVEGWIEELVVRRELSDNFCYHQPNYDNVAGASDWARQSLQLHAADKREHLYSTAELEAGKTADRLWNAAQMELVHVGKMHGFMRMYWAKKILEWTASPEQALADAILLNDKYSLDGRDPNGYVGCMWSICGIHDMGWAERAVFGKIRYMNYAGCKRKFNVEGYIARIGNEVLRIKKGGAATAGAAAAAAAGPA
jgi:deoxyribodipyrimidine photo-lyase